MARTLLTYPSAKIALVNATRKGIVVVNGGYGIRQIIKEAQVSFDGINPSGKPIYCRFCLYGTSSIGSGTGLVAQKQNRSDINPSGDTYQAMPLSSARENFTVPGSGLQILASEEVHPNGGCWFYRWPEGREPELIGDAMCFFIDALLSEATVCNGSGRVMIEE